MTNRSIIIDKEFITDNGSLYDDVGDIMFGHVASLSGFTSYFNKSLEYFRFMFNLNGKDSKSIKAAVNAVNYLNSEIEQCIIYHEANQKIPKNYNPVNMDDLEEYSLYVKNILNIVR